MSILGILGREIDGRLGKAREGIGIDNDGSLRFRLMSIPRSGMSIEGIFGSEIDGRLGSAKEGIGSESDGSFRLKAQLLI